MADFEDDGSSSSSSTTTTADINITKLARRPRRRLQNPPKDPEPRPLPIAGLKIPVRMIPQEGENRSSGGEKGGGRRQGQAGKSSTTTMEQECPIPPATVSTTITDPVVKVSWGPETTVAASKQAVKIARKVLGLKRLKFRKKGKGKHRGKGKQKKKRQQQRRRRRGNLGKKATLDDNEKGGRGEPGVDHHPAEQSTADLGDDEKTMDMSQSNTSPPNIPKSLNSESGFYNNSEDDDDNDRAQDGGGLTPRPTGSRPRSRAPPPTPPDLAPPLHPSLSLPTLPVFHAISDPTLVDQYRTQRAGDPTVFDQKTKEIKRAMERAKVERGGKKGLNVGDYTVELASREDAERVEKWVEGLKFSGRDRGENSGENEDEMDIDGQDSGQEDVGGLTTQTTAMQCQPDGTAIVDHEQNNSFQKKTGADKSKRMQRKSSFPTDFNLSKHVCKYICSGSVRHQHSSTVETREGGERTVIVKTWIEITQETTVPKSESATWDDVIEAMCQQETEAWRISREGEGDGEGMESDTTSNGSDSGSSGGDSETSSCDDDGGNDEIFTSGTFDLLDALSQLQEFQHPKLQTTSAVATLIKNVKKKLVRLQNQVDQLE